MEQVIITMYQTIFGVVLGSLILVIILFAKKRPTMAHDTVQIAMSKSRSGNNKPTKKSERRANVTDNGAALKQIPVVSRKDFDSRVAAISSHKIVATAAVPVPTLDSVKAASAQRKVDAAQEVPRSESEPAVEAPMPSVAAASRVVDDAPKAQPARRPSSNKPLIDYDAVFRELAKKLSTWKDKSSFVRMFSVQTVNNLDARGSAVIYRFGAKTDMARIALAVFDDRKDGNNYRNYAIYEWNPGVSKWGKSFDDRDVRGQTTENNLPQLDVHGMAEKMVAYVEKATP